MYPAFFLLQMLIASFVIHDVTAASLSCSEREWNECSKHLVTFMEKPGFPVNLTDDEITAFCNGILPETLECEDAFAQKCLNVSALAAFRNDSTEAKELRKEACNHAESENSTECTSSGWDQCLKQVNKLTSLDFQSTQSFNHHFEDLASVCTIMKESFECVDKFSDRCFDDDTKVKFEKSKGQIQNNLLVKCNLGRKIDCKKEMQQCGRESIYLKSHGLMTAVTESDLLAACKSTRDYIDCVTDYARKCEDTPAMQQAEEVFPMQLRLMKTICKPGDPFIPKFLNYTTCFSKFAAEYRQCSSDFLREREMVMNSPISNTLKQEESCCYFEYFQHCARTAAQNKCGKDVAATGEKIIEELSGEEIIRVCSAFRYDSPQCSFLNGATTTSATPIASSGTITGWKIDCETEMQQCGREGIYLKSHSLLTAVTESELRAVCKSAREYIDCVTDYARKCEDTPAVQQAKELFPMQLRLMKAVCKPGDPFIPKFLNYTTCFLKFATEYRQCSSDFLREREIVMKSPISNTLKEEESCCYFEYFQHCIRTAAQNNCGKDVAETGEKIFEQLSGEEIVRVCSAFKYDSPQCSFLNAATTTSATPIASSGTITGKPEECRLSQKCLDDLYFLGSHSIKTVTTESELMRTCRLTENALSCTRNYVDHCTEASRKPTVKKNVATIQLIKNAICNRDYSFRQRYLKYTTCHPKFAAQVEACSSFFNEKEKMINEMEIPVNSKLAKSCCLFETSQQCIRTAVESKCGKAVADTALELNGIFEGNKTLIICSPFKYNNPECPSSSSSSACNTTPSPATASTTGEALNTPLPLKNSATTFATFPSFYFFVFIFVSALCY